MLIILLLSGIMFSAVKLRVINISDILLSVIMPQCQAS
jgi:hypothetical protein